MDIKVKSKTDIKTVNKVPSGTFFSFLSKENSITNDSTLILQVIDTATGCYAIDFNLNYAYSLEEHDLNLPIKTYKQTSPLELEEE